jgi:regulatory protein
MTIEKAKYHALKYLAYRPRTIKEISNYLEKKQYNRQIIAEVINYLKAQSYLDDDKFCQLWIENRCRFKPMGQKGLFYELINKGIDIALIEKNLIDNFPTELELEMAKQLILKKTRFFDDSYPKEKIMAYLFRRGFSKSIIYQAVKEFEASNSS